MPHLDWIGKGDVVNHDRYVPFRLLKKIQARSIGDSENLLIEGDNLEALKSLIPSYRGKIKCIYIDPPYNTGNEEWAYNDKVNSPKIRKWLCKVVKSDDLSKHDKWLCMMYPRLLLLRELLSDDGVIFVSIDHNEEHHLRMLLDEIFGDSNYRNTFVVSRVKKNIRERKKIRALNFGYNSIVFYAKSDRGLVVPVTKPRKKSKNDWHGFDAPGVRPTMSYELFGMVPPETRHWMYAKERAQEMIRSGKLRRNKNTGKPEYKLDKKYMMLDTNWTDIQESSSKFNFPNGEKNAALVRRLISMVDDKEAIILDSFAGTGTTAEAVIQANEKDGGSRKFILVELEPEISRNTTFRRLSDAVKRSANNSHAKNSGFAYCTLDNELFDCNGAINSRCTFEQIARYVFFAETRKPLESKMVSGPFLGKSDGTEYYLFFSTMRKSSTLDFETLKSLPKETKKVVYADSCRVSEARLKEYNMTFKQTPYDLDVDAL